MNQKHFLSQAAVAMTLVLCLAGCGSNKDMGSTVSPSASVSPSPAVTEDTGSSAWDEDRSSGVEDSAVDRPSAEEPMNTETPNTSDMPSDREGTDSQAGEDMKQAGEDLGDAAQNAGRSIENGLKGQ